MYLKEVTHIFIASELFSPELNDCIELLFKKVLKKYPLSAAYY